MAYITGFEILSPLGNDAESNFRAVANGETSIKENNHFFTSQFSQNQLHNFSKSINAELDLTDKTALLSQACLQKLQNQIRCSLSDKNCQLIICSTKGNIDAPIDDADNASPLLKLSATLENIFRLANKPIVISNACISGLSGIIEGCRLLKNTKLDNVVVLGVDVVSQFVLDGFRSLTAIDDKPCRPYDVARNGISLGEAVAALVLSKEKSQQKENFKIVNYGITNDANHISGPSRTGKGLADAVKKAMQNNLKVDFVAAHGTGTNYNDEMESLAFQTTGFTNVPILSHKGNVGHTLGASGVLETILSCLSLKNNTITASKGFDKKGVSGNITILAENMEKPLQSFLKTGSGFGGGNAALVAEKV